MVMALLPLSQGLGREVLDAGGGGVAQLLEQLGGLRLQVVAEFLDGLEGAHPGFKERVLDDGGQLRRFVNVFVADDDVRFLDGLNTPVPDGETVAIIPAVAGG